MSAKAYPIEKFWSKMLAKSKSINKIPSEYLEVAQNSRIFDWGIGPRRWKTSLTESTLWTNNKGGFMLNWNLYQITNSKIYLIDLDTWTQTEIVDLGYDAVTDILIYSHNRGSFTSLATDTVTYATSTDYSIQKATYNNVLLKRFWFYDFDNDLVESATYTTDNTTRTIPAVRIVKAGTDYYDWAWNWDDDWLGVVLLEWEYLPFTIQDGSCIHILT